MAREQKTSFNICSVSVAKYGSAYQHQKPEHRASLNYIHSDRTQLNESWHKEFQANGNPKTLRNYLADTKKIVKAKTGRAMQKRAEDNVIGEAVVVIDEKTTMEELQLLGKKMEDRYGWTCVQIHIHKDEGYLGKRTEEMKHREGKYNLHAHMFFITTNLANGKSWKRKRGEGSVMQDITAQTLNLTRGVRKSEQTNEVKETLNVIEFKEDQARKNLKRAREEQETIGKEVEQAKANIEFLRKEVLELEESKEEQENEINELEERATEVQLSTENAAERLNALREDISTSEATKAKLEQITQDLEDALRPTQDKQIRTLAEIKESHTKRYIGGLVKGSIDYEAVAEELWEQQMAGETNIVRNDFIMVQKYKGERDQARNERDKAKEEAEKLRSQNETLKEEIVKTLGEKFASFWQDVKRFSQNLLMAIGLWRGETWNNCKEVGNPRREEYTADRNRCLLLINGKSQDEREEEFRKEVQRVYKRAVETSGESWALLRLQKLSKIDDYYERVRELKDFEKTAEKMNRRGIRR